MPSIGLMQLQVDGIEKEITESEKTASSGEYGANGEFLELVDQCFTLKKQQYKYEVGCTAAVV